MEEFFKSDGRIASPSILFKKQNLKPDESKAIYIDSVILPVPVHCVYLTVFGEVPHYTWKDSQPQLHVYASASVERLLICVPLH